MQLTCAQAQYFDRCAKEILSLPLVKSMKRYPQHGKTSCLCHCIMVAKRSYWLAVRLNQMFQLKINYSHSGNCFMIFSCMIGMIPITDTGFMGSAILILPTMRHRNIFSSINGSEM